VTITPGAPRGSLLMKSATYAAVAVASTLVLIKIWAWWRTGSVAMLGSLVDSGLDVMISTVNLAAVHAAVTPADREHRFGHGKAEAIAGLLQGVVISASAIFLIVQSVKRIMAPEPLDQSVIGIGVMVASIVLTIGLVYFQRHVIKRSGSLAIRAESLHYASDLLMNLGVIAALVISGLLGVPYVDPVIAIVIAAVLLDGARRIAIQSFDMVMDREFPDDDRQKIKDIVLAHDDVVAMHDLRTRSSGTSSFIQFHIELDPTISLVKSHDISDEVEASVAKEFPDAEILIHQDPYGIDEQRIEFPKAG
jgi:ferrous-iron efflux pump FieF